MNVEEYNGWKNRETWAAKLWIDNDQALYEIAREYAQEEIQGHDEGEEINAYHLGQTFKGWIEDDLLTLENIAGNQALFNMLTDIGSLYRVDWREIAQAFIDDEKEGESK
jgi:hypothetical protein